ncbi:hypothetical protein HUU62_12695 [Rhodoferax sp. 4810]|nr:hypothetical protein [Rhodoferax jenense]
MVPEIFGQDYVDGVYWTLQYELSFYALILLALLFNFHKKLDTFFLTWPFAILLAGFSNLSPLPYLGGYYCYFSAGAVLAILKEQKTWRVMLAVLISCYLCIDFSAGKSEQLSSIKGFIYSANIIGYIIILYFVFFLVLISKWGSTLSLPGSTLAGGLTYPIYLIHAHFGYMILSRFGSSENRAQIYLVTFFLVFCVAFLVHIFVEKRLSKQWKNIFRIFVTSPLDVLTKKMTALRG